MDKERKQSLIKGLSIASIIWSFFDVFLLVSLYVFGMIAAHSVAHMLGVNLGHLSFSETDPIYGLIANILNVGYWILLIGGIITVSIRSVCLFIGGIFASIAYINKDKKVPFIIFKVLATIGSFIFTDYLLTIVNGLPIVFTLLKDEEKK